MLKKARNKLTSHYGRYLLSWFTRDDPWCERELTILMPLAPKDVGRARTSIPAIRRNVAHPISRMLVIGPDCDDLRAVCRETGAEFIDELEPLSELLGAARARELNGWFKQQILKLISPRIAAAELVLTFDSDTYPTRPTSFLTSEGQVRLHWAEPHPNDYHKFTEALIGPTPGFGVNYIAHCMLFQRAHLEAMYSAIRDLHGKPWQEALLELLQKPYEEVGFLSEFDLYGHFLRGDRPQACKVRYYSNLKVEPGVFLGDTPMVWWNRRFRFLSNHRHGV